MRALLRALAPPWLLTRYRRDRLVRAARRLARAAPASAAPEAWWDAVSSSPWFAPLQEPHEILGLLRFALQHGGPPHTVCEVGVASGGTSFLLARAAADDATIVLVDQQFRDGRDQALAQFARGRQRLVCVSGNSHADATLAAVRTALAGQSLDLLLIDADHRLASVTRDFEQYTPLLRPGGLVAFHDIVPDHRKRFGKETGRDAGDVAEFWRALGDRYGGRHEFVHHPDQDGCGIGVLVWQGPA